MERYPLLLSLQNIRLYPEKKNILKPLYYLQSLRKVPLFIYYLVSKGLYRFIPQFLLRLITFLPIFLLFIYLFCINIYNNIYLLFFCKNLFFFFKFYFLEIFIVFNIIWILINTKSKLDKSSFFFFQYVKRKEIFFFKRLNFFIFFAFFFSLFDFFYIFNIGQFSYFSDFFFYTFCLDLSNFYFHFFFFNNFLFKFFRLLLLFLFFFISCLFLFDLQKSYACYLILTKFMFIQILLFLFLIFFSLLFILVFDLFLLFLLIIGLNITIYTLLIFDSISLVNYYYSHSNMQAGVKYFILSTTATLFILGGVSLSLLIFNNTNLFYINQILLLNKSKFLFDILFTFNESVLTVQDLLFVNLENSLGQNLTEIFNMFIKLYILFWNYNVFIIFIFLSFGFFFKLSLFPLHSWSIDVYGAVTLKIIAIFILIFKTIFFYKFVQIFFTGFHMDQNLGNFSYILLFISLGSIFFGSFSGLFEDRIKRLLAFSSVNQMGFIFLGLLPSENYDIFVFPWNTILGLQSSFFFLFIYLFTNLFFFYCLSFFSISFEDFVYIKDLRNLPLVFLLNIFFTFLSFSGLPPFPGFFAKFQILLTCWNLGYVYTSFFVLFFSIFSCYYYLKIIKIIFFDYSLIDTYLFSNYAFFKFHTFNNSSKFRLLNYFASFFLFFIISFVFFMDNYLYISLLLSISTLFFL